MASTIKIKNSSTAGATPSAGDLVQGELAVNVTDKKIFTKNSSGTVVLLSQGIAGTGPAFRANTVTAQSFASSTFTKVAFNVEEFDTNSNYDPTTNYRFTPTVAGYYQINANVSLGGGTIGYVQCALYKNGNPYCSGSGIPNNNTVGGMVTASTVLYLNGSTDYVEFYLWQNQGTSISLQTATGNNTFSGVLVRAA